MLKGNSLNYCTPAAEWAEGMPLGNGSLGAMFWGEAGQERLTLNHEFLFRKKYSQKVKTAHIIPEIRKLVLNAEASKAEDIIKEAVKDYTNKTNPYQVLGELLITVPAEKIMDYRRSLDFETGVANIEFSADGNSLKMEAFIAPDTNILAVRVCSENKTSISFGLIRTEDAECHLETVTSEKTLEMRGSFDEGVSFYSYAKFDSHGRCCDGAVCFENTKEITVFLTAGTNAGGSTYEECLNTVKNADYEQLRVKRINKSKEDFNTVDFWLNSAKETSTEQLFSNSEIIEPLMYVQILNAARYYTLASSGKLPMNLQGIWNDKINPMWECGYTTDMNVQMHHWITMHGNMFDCQKPLFAWLSENMDILKEHSKNVFGCRGIAVAQYTDMFFVPALDVPGFQLFWSGAAGWLASHFYEYYLYTKDEEFLQKTALPFMTEAACFYVDWLQRDENGAYYSCPSLSPENMTKDGNWLVNTSTMDITIVRQLFTSLIEAYKQLKIQHKDEAVWHDILDNLHDYPVDDYGRMREWIENSDEMDPYHRHLSHIYGLFPGKVFANPEDVYYKAAKKAIEERRKGGFGNAATWSHAWYACCYARLNDGNTSLSCINDVIKSGLMTNYLTTHNDWRESEEYSALVDGKVMQIDALLGTASAICEMFVRSLSENEIQICMAVPDDWKRCGGKINGLRAYGGLEIDIKWDDNVITSLVFKSFQDVKTTVKLGMKLNDCVSDRLKIKMKAGETAALRELIIEN